MNYKLINQKLDELNLDGYKHIKNNDWDEPNKLQKWLKSKNFKLMGEGLYSSVYKSDDEDFVVKVNNGSIDFGYLSFVEFCQNNKNNPHLPKMGKIKKYENWYIIFIEKLEPVGNNAGMLLDFLQSVDGYLPTIHDTNELLIYCNKYFDTSYSSYDELVKNIPYGDQMFSLYKCLVEIIEECGYKYHDLHMDNIMLRNSTIVIVDPFG